jgi:hypothetical protein
MLPEMRSKPLAGPVVEVQMVLFDLSELVPAVQQGSDAAAPKIGRPPVAAPAFASSRSAEATSERRLLRDGPVVR